MLRTTRFSGSASRQIFIFGQLLATVCLTGLLAYQARDAARSHRVTAEAVLTDYAALASREFVNASSIALGYYGSTPILRVFRDLDWPLLPPAMTVHDLDLTEIGNPKPDPSIMFSFCRFDLETEEAFHAGGHEREQLQPFLQMLAKRDYDKNWPYAVLFSPSQDTILIYHIFDREKRRYEGFLVDVALLNLFFDDVLQKRRLLPMSRGNKRIVNGLLRVAVFGPNGPIYTVGDGKDEIRAGRPFGYGLKDMRVEISLGDDLAGDLIIGGLPGSRVPVLLVLMMLTVGLVGVTLWQIGRERALAVRQADSLAAVSHELRTPLSQIQMFSETLLLDRVRTPEEGRRALEIIVGETRRMGDLVENIVRFSSALHGLSKPSLAPVAVPDLFKEQIAHFNQIGDNRQNRFELALESAPSILAEPGFMRRILRNLIDNALKYGPSDKPIVLGLAQKNNEVHIWIEDRGEGVPARFRDLIWDRFERLPVHRNTSVAGSGIGLWLVRELAHAQGARAWVERGSGGGARFVLAFRPAAAPANPRQDPSPDESTSELTS